MLKFKTNLSFFIIWFYALDVGDAETGFRPYRLYRRNCDSQGVLIYEDMNCNLETRKRNGCPSEYSCPNWEKIENTCWYKGQTYQTGQMTNQSQAFCQVGCFCEQKEDGMGFICAVVDCFGLPPDSPCYNTYNLEFCCPNGTNCPIDPPYQCVYKGEKYREGERFFPRDSCSMCVCGRGFRGRIEPPFCTRRKCDVELNNLADIQNACAPLYEYEEDLRNHILCCPSSWVCPDGNEVVIGEPIAETKCRFGNITIRVGQEIRKHLPGDPNNENVCCSCNVAPLLTCVRHRKPQISVG